MRRIYINATLKIGQITSLNDETFHYVVRVLRCRDGEQLKVFNGDGNDYQATLQLENKKTANVLVENYKNNQNESPLYTILIQGLSKGDRMDIVMQKGVELGVNEIYPVRTDFCAVKLDGQRLKKKMQHWQSVIISACEQSERAVVPVLKPLQPLEDVFTQIDTDKKWMLHPYEKKYVMKQENDQPNSVAIVIGPEGGLSNVEVEIAITQGFMPTTLGKRILRTETAAIAALSSAQQLWGDFNV